MLDLCLVLHGLVYFLGRGRAASVLACLQALHLLPEGEFFLVLSTFPMEVIWSPPSASLQLPTACCEGCPCCEGWQSWLFLHYCPLSPPTVRTTRLAGLGNPSRPALIPGITVPLLPAFASPSSRGIVELWWPFSRLAAYATRTSIQASAQCILPRRRLVGVVEMEIVALDESVNAHAALASWGRRCGLWCCCSLQYFWGWSWPRPKQ